MFEASIATKKELRPNPPNSHIVGNVYAGNQPIFFGCSREIVKVLASASGRKLPLISVLFSVPERPHPVKADVQILTLEISLPSDRYTLVSGNQADTMPRGRCRPKADVAAIPVLAVYLQAPKGSYIRKQAG